MFVTATTTKYAVDAFEREAIDYLLETVTREAPLPLNRHEGSRTPYAQQPSPDPAPERTGSQPAVTRGRANLQPGSPPNTVRAAGSARAGRLLPLINRRGRWRSAVRIKTVMANTRSSTPQTGGVACDPHATLPELVSSPYGRRFVDGGCIVARHRHCSG